jgi:hypothetical protein
MFAPGITTFIIAPFLSNNELLECSRSNRLFHDQLNPIMKERKMAFINKILQYFYTDENKSISIHTRFHHKYSVIDEPYRVHVRNLFTILPELFEFIQMHHITRLDLGCVTSYGGYPESPYHLVNPTVGGVINISNQILSLLSQNKTLTYCNFGLFQNIMQRKDIINAVEKHPVLDSLSMLSLGARTDFRSQPHMLWRDHTGGFFYWDHFRHDS